MPKSGYWTKLKAGKSPKREPLPSSWGYGTRRSKPSRVKVIIRYEAPKTDYHLARPSELITETRKALVKAGPNAYGIREATTNGLLKTKLSPESFDRGLWLWNQLSIKAREKGVLISVVKGCYATFAGHKVEIHLREMASEGVADDAEDERWLGTGVLVFRAEGRKEWKDGSVALDDQLDEIAEKLKQVLVEKDEAATRAEAEKIKREESARLRAIEERRKVEEEAQISNFRDLAALAFSHLQMLALIEALETELGSDTTTQVQPWLEWAKKACDENDPVKRIAEKLRAGENPNDIAEELYFLRPLEVTNSIPGSTGPLPNNFWSSRAMYRRKH